jgi:hypothetical protein
MNTTLKNEFAHNNQPNEDMSTLKNTEYQFITHTITGKLINFKRTVKVRSNIRNIHSTSLAAIKLRKQMRNGDVPHFQVQNYNGHSDTEHK